MLRQWSYKEHWLDQGLDLPGSLYGDPKLTRMHLGKPSKKIMYAATYVDVVGRSLHRGSTSKHYV